MYKQNIRNRVSYDNGGGGDSLLLGTNLENEILFVAAAGREE